MQSAFFFLYNGTVCLAFFLMLGTLGWRSSLSFVRHIYRCRHLPRTTELLTLVRHVWGVLKKSQGVAAYLMHSVADSSVDAPIYAGCIHSAVSLTCFAMHCSAIKSDLRGRLQSRSCCQSSKTFGRDSHKEDGDSER